MFIPVFVNLVSFSEKFVSIWECPFYNMIEVKLQLPYDTRSVMHFGSKQLGKYGQGWTIMKNDGSEIIPNKVRNRFPISDLNNFVF